ncbi:hypothetical protein [Lyngbya sp. PCC 8106]|uniref:hypothetical protein n=1 Tax=Lyngbya sp. (strain PCC 8106) TaxID=313612 RepID=UPI0000EAC7AB|nr:hypothetical protein [Lyngbya sp. PCC 8106]EAW38849.1 hypothetical protein L8106_15580 [Lyngbya sp. PCC 8106]
MTQSHKSQFFLGCAVWAYKDWIGDFYPPGSRSTDFLKLYIVNDGNRMFLFNLKQQHPLV